MSLHNDNDNDPTAHWSFETKQIHVGQRPNPVINARALPIYQTTSYTFDDTAHAAALFGLEIPGNIYTRIGNPTTEVVEQRITALEGGAAALFLASGQAAETFAILTLAGAHLLGDYGSAASPFNAFLVAQGLETLSLRVQRHVANAQRVAEFLADHDDVLSVNYAGLPGSPWFERAKKLAPKGTGAVLSFELAGGVEAGKAFVNALKLHSHVANIGDVLAVGIEGIDDILADLELGFTAARAHRGTTTDPQSVAAL